MSGPRTIEVLLDQGAPNKLAGNATDSSGNSLPITFETFGTADTFNVTVGPKTALARFWRDSAGSVQAIQIDAEGDFGPPFFRLP